MWKSIDICVIRKLHLLCSFVYSRLRTQIYKAVAESISSCYSILAKYFFYIILIYFNYYATFYTY